MGSNVIPTSKMVKEESHHWPATVVCAIISATGTGEKRADLLKLRTSLTYRELQVSQDTVCSSQKEKGQVAEAIRAHHTPPTQSLSIQHPKERLTRSLCFPVTWLTPRDSK